ncbi:hypothetical protein [Rhizobium leguminosarum]|uniref:hypothetical protein n=1 Tax=Rhizobium leguminosarum TaxID=384 RepID=UPI001C945588|nr:hypothetical protein [Rhizobium leguminosarum]MBY5422288.1 hypothetical protein [Rhizobium leguminosarum]
MIDSQSCEPGAADTANVSEAYRLVELEIIQLERAHREIKVRLEKAVSARDLLRQLISPDLAPGGEEKMGGASDKRKKAKSHHRGSLTGEIVTRAKLILQSAERPLARSQLLKEIENDGFRVTANDPARFIGRALWESEAFVHIPKQGYWLKDRTPPSKGSKS